MISLIPEWLRRCLGIVESPESLEALVHKKVEAEDFRSVRVTAAFLAKLFQYGGVYRRITEAAQLGPQEFGFWLLGDQEVISDMRLPRQYVRHDYSEVAQHKRHIVEVREKEGIGLVSWGHYHGSFGPSPSPRDLETLQHVVPSFYEGFSYRAGHAEIVSYPTIIFNECSEVFAGKQYHWLERGKTHAGKALLDLPLVIVPGRPPRQVSDDEMKSELLEKVHVLHDGGYRLLGRLVEGGAR
ncbi:MAG: hypothetical protein V1735_04770 [Nanoarchaeota archaeon]